jgi:RHS repeat-associated protein
MVTTYFHWHPTDDCVTHETDGSGSPIVTYNHSPGQFGPLISESRSGTTYTHHYDALGSTTALTDAGGTTSDTFRFDAWGNSIARTGGTLTPYRWVGRWGYQSALEADTLYIRARQYSSLLGRFTSVDPLLYLPNLAQAGVSHTSATRDHGAGNAVSLPPYYIYVGSSPVNAVDPAGLQEMFIPFHQLPQPPSTNARLWNTQPWGPPGRLLNVVLPCSSFSVSQWSTDLCNFSGNPGNPSNPRSRRCQSCPCSSMRDGLAQVNAQDIQQQFDSVYTTMINDGIIDDACQIRLVVRQQCGVDANGQDFAVTCPNLNNHMGPHIICMPLNNATPCNMPPLLLHELVHVVQHCQGRGGRQQVELEREAYTWSCRAQVIQRCVPPPEQNQEIQRCITVNSRSSVNAVGNGNINQLCDNLRQQNP